MTDPFVDEDYDVLKNSPAGRHRDVLDRGFVRLVDCMPRLVPASRKTADYAAVQAARVSFGAGLRTPDEDAKTLRFFMRHTHTTPNEMVEFKFHCHMPIFVARQWIRHRTANVNEKSGRYSAMSDAFHRPAAVRAQSGSNKQGSDGAVTEAAASEFLADLDRIERDAYAAYERADAAGVAKEQSRILLPVNVYTEWYWKIDMHNLLHFLSLRCDAHAQLEVRAYADAMLEMITPIVPESVAAWNDYHPRRDAVLLTRPEADALREAMKHMAVGRLTDPKATEREQKEWVAKAARLGLYVVGSEGA